MPIQGEIGKLWYIIDTVEGKHTIITPNSIGTTHKHNADTLKPDKRVPTLGLHL